MCVDPTDYTFKVPIESIEFDDPYDSNGYSGVDGKDIEDVDEELYNDEGEYIGEKVVIINLGNV